MTMGLVNTKAIQNVKVGKRYPGHFPFHIRNSRSWWEEVTCWNLPASEDRAGPDQDLGPSTLHNTSQNDLLYYQLLSTQSLGKCSGQEPSKYQPPKCSGAQFRFQSSEVGAGNLHWQQMPHRFFWDPGQLVQHQPNWLGTWVLATAEPDHLRTHIHGFHLQRCVLIISPHFKSFPGWDWCAWHHKTTATEATHLVQTPAAQFHSIPTPKPHVFLGVPPTASILIKEEFGVTFASKARHTLWISQNILRYSKVTPEHCWTDREALNQVTFFFLATSLIRGYCEPSISVFCKEIIQFQGIRLFQRSQENKHTFSVLKPLPPLNLSFLEYLHW